MALRHKKIDVLPAEFVCCHSGIEYLIFCIWYREENRSHDASTASSAPSSTRAKRKRRWRRASKIPDNSSLPQSKEEKRYTPMPAEPARSACVSTAKNVERGMKKAISS